MKLERKFGYGVSVARELLLCDGPIASGFKVVPGSFDMDREEFVCTLKWDIAGWLLIAFLFWITFKSKSIKWRFFQWTAEHGWLVTTWGSPMRIQDLTWFSRENRAKAYARDIKCVLVDREEWRASQSEIDRLKKEEAYYEQRREQLKVVVDNWVKQLQNPL
jgi:hypothetical protein